MAQDFTYFEGYTTGVQPSDWSSRWVTTGETWAVQEAADDIRGKHLQHDRTTTARRLLSWDTPAGGSDTDTDLLVRWRSSTQFGEQFYLALRGSGGAATETGYVFRNTASTSIQISLFNAGGLSAVGSAVSIPSIIPNAWYWLRFQARGSALKAKMWSGDHEAEPAAWTIERTNSTLAGPGWFGVGNAASSATRRYDAVAVGTAGDDAVFPVSEDARTTQAAMLVLDAPDADARMTQLAALVLAEDAPLVEARATQVVALTLAEFDASIRTTQVAMLVLADQVGCFTRWAQTWTITRTDGVVQGFTSLDRALTFRGAAHQSCGSMSATAVEVSSIVGGQGSQELRGILSAAGVSESDLYHGLYDGALLESWLVPWENSGGETPVPLIVGVLGQDRHDVNELSIEILTDSAKLQQSALLEIFTPTCRYGFGAQNDARCPVDLTALTVSGTVTTTAVPVSPNNAARRVFVDSSRGEADRHFDLGQITWTSGANSGASSEIKSFAAGQFVLWDATLNPIALGDGYDATPGCNKSTTDHLRFNADLVDFGGFPHVPGIDSISDTPDAKG